MNSRNVWISLGAVAVAVPLAKWLWDSKAPSRLWTKIQNATSSKDPSITKVIEDTLQKHEGEDTPFRHAFAEALGSKNHLVEQS